MVRATNGLTAWLDVVRATAGCEQPVIYKGNGKIKDSVKNKVGQNHTYIGLANTVYMHHI